MLNRKRDVKTADKKQVFCKIGKEVEVVEAGIDELSIDVSRFVAVPKEEGNEDSGDF